MFRISSVAFIDAFMTCRPPFGVGARAIPMDEVIFFIVNAGHIWA